MPAPSGGKIAALGALLCVQVLLVGAASPRYADREPYKRVIDDKNDFGNQVPKLVGNVLSDEFLKKQFNNRASLITKDSPLDNVIAENVIVESNTLQLVTPRKYANRLEDETRRLEAEGQSEPKRRLARGWNLQFVNVPNAPPYIPYNFYSTRGRRWRRCC